MAPRADAAERILRLAAYAHRIGRPVGLGDIVADVPGYQAAGSGPLEPRGTEWERVRKLVSRDVTDLREHWGIDLAYDEHAHHYALRAPFLTGPERAALIAAAATVDVEGVDVPAPGALGSAVGDDATQIILHVHELVAALRAAIASRRAVRFVHDGQSRHVEPYALGTWRTHWYVAARDLDEGALRRYRLDRIEPGDGHDTIVPDDAVGTYEIPADFDVERAFDLDPNTWGTDPCVRARVRVGADHVDAFRRELGGEMVAESDGRVVLELDVRHYVSFRNRLLAFRTNAQVLEPAVLVALVRDHLHQLAAR
jgi:predicted DNA-binding transcriptional regulator YafY